MNEYIENAQITDTFLGIEDHGIFTFSIMLDYGSSGQGFGHYSLDGYNKELKKREGWANGIMVLRGILEAVGVDSWEKLKGRYVRVKRVGEHEFSAMVRAIGHPIKDKWMDVREFSVASNDDD